MRLTKSKYIFMIIVMVLTIIGITSTVIINKDKKDYEGAILANGGFETGDLEGWTVIEGEYGNEYITSQNTYWDTKLLFNKEGKYHFYGLGKNEKIPETETCKIKSSTFILKGTGKISFKLGAGKDNEKCYLAVYLADDDKCILKQPNTKFRDIGVSYTSSIAFTNNYQSYDIDLSDYLGQEMYIVIVDEDNDGDFGFLNVDGICTYYQDENLF